MQYSMTRHLTQSNLLHKLGLSSLVLASLLSSSPSVAATQSPISTTPSEPEPVLIANLFRRIGDAVRDARQIVETVNSVDSFLQQMGGGGNTSPQPQATPQPATPNVNPAPVAAPAPHSTTAQASSDVQIIHRDDSPTNCHTHTQLSCEAFQMVAIPAEGALIFNYYFDGAPFSFVTSTASEFRLDNAASYQVFGLIYNNETVEMRGICSVTIIGGTYRAALCQAENGIEFTYTNLN